MIWETIFNIVLLIGVLLLFVVVLVLGDEDDTINKIMDESCYYCMFSKTPHSIRDKTKNTCTIVDNTMWSSEQIRNCKYRCKR